MIPFLAYRRAAIGASLLFLAAGLALFFTKGFVFDVDFQGGTEIAVSFPKRIDTEKIRKALEEAGVKDASVQGVEGEKAFIIQVPTEDAELGKRLFEELKKRVSQDARLDSLDWVGSAVGKDIRKDALIAVLAVLLATLAYISLSSKYRFAVGAVVAIGHDLLATLTVFLITREKISANVLMALLTVLGYSLNDTIVIFSKVAENLKKLRSSNIPEVDIFNLSINQTLRRTMLTSVSTFIAVATLYFLGGPALKGFSLAMMTGVVVGTYSSIFIASPVALAIGGGEKNSGGEEKVKKARLQSSFAAGE